jgi:hypothetical protein
MGRLKYLKPRIRVLDTRRVKPLKRAPTAADGFYASSEWRSFVTEIIEERGRRCEDSACKTPHGPWGRIIGDHIREISDGGLRLDPRNIMLRCAGCHNRKTAEERTRRNMEPVIAI